jgi:hypothetical protein
MGRTRPPDIVHNDVAGAEKRLRKLKRSFSKVARRLDRQQFYRAVLAVVVIVLVIAVGIAAYFNFQPLNFPD